MDSNHVIFFTPSSQKNPILLEIPKSLVYLHYISCLIHKAEMTIVSIAIGGIGLAVLVGVILKFVT